MLPFIIILNSFIKQSNFSLNLELIFSTFTAILEILNYISAQKGRVQTLSRNEFFKLNHKIIIHLYFFFTEILFIFSVNLIKLFQIFILYL